MLTRRARGLCPACRFVAGDEPQEANGTAQDGAPAAAGDPLTPAFLLQLIKLLRRKQTLLDKAKQHNDAMTASARARASRGAACDASASHMGAAARISRCAERGRGSLPRKRAPLP